MTEDRNDLLVAALDEWRLSNVERDWDAVVDQAIAACPRRRARSALGILGQRRYLKRIAFVAVALAVAAPAIAAVSGALSWPWSHRPGTQLVATVPSLPGTSLRIHSHGAPIARTRSGILFVGRAAVRQRRFAWQLATEARIGAASIVLPDGHEVRLCSPCKDGVGGAFTLSGSRALDILNGRSILRVRSNDHTTTSPVELKRLR